MTTDRGLILPPADELVDRVNKYGIRSVASAYEVSYDAVWHRLARAGYKANKMGIYRPTYVKQVAS